MWPWRSLAYFSPIERYFFARSIRSLYARVSPDLGSRSAELFVFPPLSDLRVLDPVILFVLGKDEAPACMVLQALCLLLATLSMVLS